MHKVASLNGKIIVAGDATINAVSSAALYGRGVFTTVAVRNGEPFLWQKHRQRLRTDAARIGLDISTISFEAIEYLLAQLIRENAVENGRGRVTLFDENPGPIWSGDNKGRISTLIITGDTKEQPESLRLTLSAFPLNSRSPLVGVKSCNYLENILVLEDAHRSGFDETVRTNERGEVASACVANLFWLSDGQLFTPDLKTGCLAGTTREFVLESLDCQQVKTTIDDLLLADAVFVSSTGVGVKPAASLNERIFQSADHEILRLLPPANTKTRMSAS